MAVGSVQILSYDADGAWQTAIFFLLKSCFVLVHSSQLCTVVQSSQLCERLERSQAGFLKISTRYGEHKQEMGSVMLDLSMDRSFENF
jgi:hypothetical protein